jgi:8-oxo-dGTP pyrophosphatase MutT (NUDIX family)
MTSTIHKVTCLITRTSSLGSELLLFKHPNAGIQIPAGTVEPGEEIEPAARREAYEETGLDALVLVRLLGKIDDPPPTGRILIATPTPVYSRPLKGSFDWAHFRRRLAVEVLRHTEGFTQVRYEEPDRYPDPKYTTYSITGWVPDDALTDQRIRHFYRFEAPGETPDQWSVATDNHIFELFWAPLDNLPAIANRQAGWVKWLI